MCSFKTKYMYLSSTGQGNKKQNFHTHTHTHIPLHIPVHILTHILTHIRTLMNAHAHAHRGCAANTKGTAFVVYEDIFDAKNACEHLSGFNVCNRYLVVLYYQPHKVCAVCECMCMHGG